MMKVGCASCGKKHLIRDCTYCGKPFCHDHLLPEAHSCSGLTRDWEAYRREREKRVGVPPAREPIEVYEYIPSKTHEVAKGIAVLIAAIIAIWVLLQLLS